MHQLLLKHLLVITCATIITACAPPKQMPEVVIAQKGLQSSANTHGNPGDIKSWDLSGALAAKNKNKAWTASLNWLQQGPNLYQIRLFGPLGSGTIMIEKKGNSINFVDGDKRLSSHNADELFEQQTGIRLPVENLYYWVRGLPAPGAMGSTQKDEVGHLISLDQSGYHINYSHYSSASQYQLPGQIQLQGHGVVIKLVIKRWTV